MPTLPVRAAAYTRTGILRRFLDQIGVSVPTRVDNDYAQERLDLKGGDVRAFLQSVRVLGLVDPYGGVTDMARRSRANSQRSAVIQEGLSMAYPELVEKWEARGSMPREEVEDFFKVEYGLSASSAAPAAKLFCDLQREFSGAGSGRKDLVPDSMAAPEPLPPAANSAARKDPAPQNGAPTTTDVRVAALDAVKSSLHIDINADWDPDKIDLVFDRMERLVSMVIQGTTPPKNGR